MKGVDYFGIASFIFAAKALPRELCGLAALILVVMQIACFFVGV